MSVLLDENGVQILPPVGDERATVAAWTVQQCVSADHRAKSAVFAELASRFLVVVT